MGVQVGNQLIAPAADGAGVGDGTAKDGADRAIERIPLDRSLSLRERRRLALEILRSYRQARRTLSQVPIEPAVTALRGDGEIDASGRDERETLAEAWRLGQAVQRTLRLVPGDTRCLTRSLVLTQLLGRRGIAAKLVIGACTQPSFRAHAWVEQAGRPVLPPGDDSFGRLVEL